MPFRQRLLLLQLPRLDPDVIAPGENVMLAAAGLQSALARSSEGAHWEALPTPAAQDTADNATLLAAVLALEPDVIGATLYLWNVERTLRLLAALRRLRPRLRSVVGGPEVAREHPLLFAPAAAGGPCAPVDVAVIGEGEVVFPDILAALRLGQSTPWRTVAWRQQEQWVFGGRTPPTRPLSELLPQADHPVCRPDAHGMAYLETSRGCPLHCAFCCYNLRRQIGSSLPPAEVGRRVRILRRRGAREIRLVDPTFNAHPRFRAVLGALRRANADRRVKFFVELRADTLTERDAADLAAANVAEAEVGVQSTDPAVLRAIHRPANLDRVLAGIEWLQRHGIRPTIDFMYGLPRQDVDDLERSLAVLARFPDAHPQFLPTLLLPGTELRDRRRELKLHSQPLPPYRVQSTDRLSARQLAAIETMAEARLGGFDTPTRRFVGQRLPNLFAEQVIVNVGGRQAGAASLRPYLTDPSRRGDLSAHALAGAANRRAVIFRGANLYAHRQALADALHQAVRREPDILWQFVLAPEREEPLDLLDELIATIRRLPSHWLDRLVSPAGTRRYAARRLFIRLPRGHPWNPGWRDTAEALLAEVFH
ncbi:MAG: B12-binding domain-containing radical SAM protein [Kiritimatiellaeota bacterium]|nr:B12-binding domain-containing radical SAM protein [Kiritimatiellota bacterium]